VAACVFCGIVAGEIPAFVVADEADTMAFLDTRPLFPGHTLVVPRRHVETLGDLPDSLLAPFFGLVKRVAVAVEAALDADGTFVAINNKVSQSVPHLHAHVVPRTRADKLRGFFWPRHKYASDDEAAAYRDKIKQALGGL
jgi:histidine triad (HIT) family protein